MPTPVFQNQTTAIAPANTQNPTVAVPAGATPGDRLIAGIVYSTWDNTIVTPPAGWTDVVAATNFANNGWFHLVQRIHATGVTGATWALNDDGTGTWDKYATAMVVYRGDDALVAGSVVNAGTVGGIVAPSVTTTEANELILGFFVDRISAQTTVTAPTGMTERAKALNTGGGGCSIMFADVVQASIGATGTKTATYGVTGANGAGLLIRLSPGASAAPVVNVGADATVTAGATFSRTATATDSDGTISSVLWTRTSGPASPTITGSTTNTMSVTPTVPGTYIYRMTATDNSSSTGFDELTLTVTDNSARPTSTVTNPGNWVNVGGATDIPAALADESATTYMETADGAIGSIITVSHSPLNPGAVTVKVDARSSTTPVATMQTRLMQGATQIAVWTDVTTTSFVQYSHTTTSTQTAAITDYSALRTEHDWLS